MNNSQSFNVQPTHIQFNMQLSLSFFTLAAVASLCGATALPPVPAKLYHDTCLDASNGLLDIANGCSSNGLSGGWADASVSYFSTLKGSLDLIPV
ncbi:hypothetical protein DFH08DRAFT_954040 [Mycena albidolilacea]|uniref:Uncharacterized protein n=1 Tax=Mycena albidolilacea TaxID=1033008 RepID=A0AAD7AEL8_9AGAR|nr:hypothetical protein DFH08DRAFT_954040 [Mycena albidolilacea]